MKDIDIIYDCLMEETYKNLVHFKIRLGEIGDKRLIRGFLTDLCLKHEKYGVNEKEIIKLSMDVLDTNLSETLYDDYQYYRKLIIVVNEKSMRHNEFSMKVLKSLTDEKTSLQNLKKILQECNDIECIEHSKAILLDNEFYRYIKLLDDRIEELV